MAEKFKPLVTRYEPDYPPGQSIQISLLNLRHIPAHVHENCLEFVYCLKGEVFIEAAHERGRIPEGHLVTVDMEDVRNLTADDDNITLIAHVSMENTVYPFERLSNILFYCATGYAAVDQTKDLRKVYNMLLSAASMDSRVDLEILRNNIVELLVTKFSWFSVVDSLGKSDGQYRDRLAKITGFVMEHCREKISQAQMASELYLSQTYLSHFFRRTTFNSYTDMVNYFRCLYAQKYLLETDKRITEISTLCGFSSDKYFYKHFKAIFGFTPLQYRKRFERYAKSPEAFTEFTGEERSRILDTCIKKRFIEDALS
mgnify:CR=1 FL=1